MLDAAAGQRMRVRRWRSIGALASAVALLAACGGSVNVPIELEFVPDTAVVPTDTGGADDIGALEMGITPETDAAPEADAASDADPTVDSAEPESAVDGAGAGDETAVVDTGMLADSELPDTTIVDTGVVDSVAADTTLVDSSIVDTALVDTSVADTAMVADTAVADSASDTSPADTSGGAVTISIADVSLAEGNAGIKSAMFTVTLSVASSKTVTVNFATSDDTATAVGAAATGGKDYSATSGVLSFVPGETSKTIYVPINGDTVDEDDETFNVTLSAPINATLLDGTAVGTITNDDTMPTLTIEDAAATEGLSGQKSITFNVVLSAASGRTVTVSYATSDGTATVGSDYIATSGSLVFESGATKKTIQVQLFGDNVVEPDETFFVTLTSPSNATLADGVATGKIVNDD